MRRNKEREKEEENRMEEKLFKDINVWSWNQEEGLSAYFGGGRRQEKEERRVRVGVII